jgi:hypothetical protein
LLAAFRARTQRGLGRKIDGLGIGVVVVARLAEVELELVFVGELQDGRERPAQPAAEACSGPSVRWVSRVSASATSSWRLPGILLIEKSHFVQANRL